MSIHHSKQKYGKDLELILNELTTSSHVFDYIPGRYHGTFKNIKPHITSHLDTDKLIQWLKMHVNKLSKIIELRNIYHP